MKGTVINSIDLKGSSGKNPANALPGFEVMTQSKVPTALLCFHSSLVPPGPPEQLLSSFYRLVSQHLQEQITPNGTTS